MTVCYTSADKYHKQNVSRRWLRPSSFQGAMKFGEFFRKSQLINNIVSYIRLHYMKWTLTVKDRR